MESIDSSKRTDRSMSRCRFVCRNFLRGTAVVMRRLLVPVLGVMRCAVQDVRQLVMRRAVSGMLLLAVLFAAGGIVLSGCKKSDKAQSIKDIGDLAGKRIVVLTGSSQEEFALRHIKNPRLVRVENISDLYLTLKTNKADVALDTYVSAQTYIRHNSGVKIVVDSIFASGIGIAFPPDKKEMRDSFNVFLKEIHESGLYQEIIDRWYSPDAMTADMPDIPNSGENGTIKIGTTAAYFPYSFISGGKNVGLDIELALRFSAKLKRKPVINAFIFSGLVASVNSGNTDIGANCIVITEERAKKLALSDPYQWTRQCVVVRSGEKASAGFIASVKDNFHKTFVQDDRYLMLLNGIWVTIKISLLAILLGTLLGSLICWMRMSSIKWLVKATKAYIYIFRGIPQVVLLMLLFYIIFSSSGINGEAVSVIGFAITFSAYVCEMFRTSIESVSKGQIEASLSMGFTKPQTFRYITMPLTVQRVFPVFTGEVISLIKGTSIVGYIAVEDITKVSDMIRSLTFDAFFSLIVVTIVYFILIILALGGLKRIQRITVPRSSRFYKCAAAKI